MASNETVAKMFALLCSNWPKEDVDKDRMRLYARILQDVPDDVLEAATLDIIASNTFFPAVAEIRQAACRIIAGRSALPTAGEAWAEVRKHLLRSGGGQYPNISKPEWGKRQFSTPLIEQAIKAMGGWYVICHSTDDDDMANRAHFFKCYDALAQRETHRARMLPEVRQVAERLEAAQMPQLEAGDGR